MGSVLRRTLAVLATTGVLGLARPAPAQQAPLPLAPAGPPATQARPWLLPAPGGQPVPLPPGQPLPALQNWAPPGPTVPPPVPKPQPQPLAQPQAPAPSGVASQTPPSVRDDSGLPGTAPAATLPSLRRSSAGALSPSRLAPLHHLPSGRITGATVPESALYSPPPLTQPDARQLAVNGAPVPQPPAPLAQSAPWPQPPGAVPMVRPQLVSPPPVMMPPAAAQPAPVRGPTTGLVQPPVSGPTGWPTPAPSVVPAARPVSQAVPAAVPIAPAQPAPSRFPLFRSLFSGNREATPTVTRPAPALTPVPATPIPNGVVVNALSSRPQSLLPGMMPSALPQGPGGVAVAGAVPPVAPANWPVGRACPGGIAPCAAVTPSAVPQPRPTTPVNPTAPYQTTGVAVFEEPAGPPGSAPAINPESLRKQVQAVCGPQAGAVRVDLGPDKIYHVHVPLTDPAAGNAVLERVLTIPEMQNPGVHLDMEMPR